MAPTTDVDPFSTEVLADPLPWQSWLREAGPLVRLARYDAHVMGRYDEVRAALADWQRFQSAAGVGVANFLTEEPWRPPSLLLEADPPHHDAPRAVLSRILGPRALRRLRQAWFADAEALVDEVVSEGELDAVTDLAQVFPLRVFPDAVGLGERGREHLLPYGDFAFNAFGPHNDLVQRGTEGIGEHSAWVGEQCRRESLAPGGFGAAIWAAADRGELTREQAQLVVRSLLTAGVDTTVHGIGAVLHAFATNPAQWRRLRDDPGSARTAFDEAVRWESPVQTFFRTTTEPVEIGGERLPAGAKVMMSLASANRDPRRWHRPDEFDSSRDPSGHLGFGMGIHQCVGQHIARLESEALLTALARRVTDIELAGEPVRHLNNTLRAWESLPIRITSR
ncbi:cytochrome P450 [Saccharopolyspora mangrovi]|uniref:Cytochrome P450 n=1 Tax=Saccharopolyspora mangrovi TaxID=3082379 RepID=A0ABU6AJE6_9PSEU|nr:cytochrome P450 [Saccharopolyspora sp. S2-29]MEB3371689.1 cytochrome P450 [Saccharopolyspora sp. S2-29]